MKFRHHRQCARSGLADSLCRLRPRRQVGGYELGIQIRGRTLKSRPKRLAHGRSDVSVQPAGVRGLRIGHDAPDVAVGITEQSAIPCPRWTLHGTTSAGRVLRRFPAHTSNWDRCSSRAVRDPPRIPSSRSGLAKETTFSAAKCSP